MTGRRARRVLPGQDPGRDVALGQRRADHPHPQHRQQPERDAGENELAHQQRSEVDEVDGHEQDGLLEPRKQNQDHDHGKRQRGGRRDPELVQKHGVEHLLSESRNPGGDRPGHRRPQAVGSGRGYIATTTDGGRETTGHQRGPGETGARCGLYQGGQCGGRNPIDVAGGGVGAGLDAAVALLDCSFGDELAGRGGAEVVHDIGFEGRLVALEEKQIIGLVGDDLVGDVDLTAHGIDGHQRAGELLGLGKVIENLGDGGDLVGLLRNAQLRQSQPCMGGVGAERMQGFKPFALVVGPA